MSVGAFPRRARVRLVAAIDAHSGRLSVRTFDVLPPAVRRFANALTLANWNRISFRIDDYHRIVDGPFEGIRIEDYVRERPCNEAGDSTQRKLQVYLRESRYPREFFEFQKLLLFSRPAQYADCGGR